jgi:tetratricopeptide (TPR) repeat protein
LGTYDLYISSSLLSEDEAAADEFMSRGEWTQAADAFGRIDNPNVRVLNKLGCLLREHLQNLPGALECHQQALLKATDREQAETLMYLGIVHNDMKQPDEAMKYYSQALQWYENVKPKDPAIIARCLVGLGNAHWACGNLDEALDCAERALVLREQEVKPRNDFDIAGCLGNMGNILHDQGNMERALECSKRAVDLFSKCEKDDPRLAASLNNLGAIYQVCGNYSKARECFERAFESLPDENHPYRTSVLNNIARLNAVEEAEK